MSAWVTLIIGFLVGAATGAVGMYYGWLFTDRRREQEARKAAPRSRSARASRSPWMR